MSTSTLSQRPQLAVVYRQGDAPAPQRVWRRALVLLLIVWCGYLANFRYISSGDSAAVRYVPFSVLMRGSLHVDGYIESYFAPFVDGTFKSGIYFASKDRNGRWMSSYPVLTPLVITPLYVPAALWLAHRGVRPEDPAMKYWAGAMEKLSAALLAALSVMVLWLALRRVTQPRIALLLAVIYGFASPTWSTSAQALWLHAMTEFSLALLLFGLTSGCPSGDKHSRRAAWWMGLGLALAMANKPANAVLALPILAWFCWGEYRAWRGSRLLPFFAPQVVLGLLVVGYNLYYFGALLGGYNSAFHTMGYGTVASALRGNLADAIAGNLVSPSRGLFFYVPWALLALWGAVQAWRRWSWAPWLLAGVVMHFLLYSKHDRWWAGWSYGPRYITDVMPVLVFCLVPLLERPARWLRPTLAATVALALFVQVVGVYCYPNGEWNSKPTNIDDAPQRLWDWHDPQIWRTLRAGPMPMQFGEVGRLRARSEGAAR
jgi:hypothetical protein